LFSCSKLKRLLIQEESASIPRRINDSSRKRESKHYQKNKERRKIPEKEIIEIRKK